MSSGCDEHGELIRKEYHLDEVDDMVIAKTNSFLKELVVIMEKYNAEIIHEFYGVVLYVDEDEIEVGNIINDLSLKGILKERSKK